MSNYHLSESYEMYFWLIGSIFVTCDVVLVVWTKKLYIYFLNPFYFGMTNLHSKKIWAKWIRWPGALWADCVGVKDTGENLREDGTYKSLRRNMSASNKRMSWFRRREIFFDKTKTWWEIKILQGRRYLWPLWEGSRPRTIHCLY